MKTKTQSFVYSLFLLSIAQWSYAQTPAAPGPTTGSVEAQITMTRDYTQSLLSRVQNAPANRFNVSSDYATQGPRIKASIEAALTEFRSAMDNLMLSPFVESIAAYNELYQDTRVPDSEKATQLSIQKRVIEQQAKTVGAVFRSEIKRLYTIVPEIVIKEFRAGRGRELDAIFGDQASLTVFDYSEYGWKARNVIGMARSLNHQLIECSGEGCLISKEVLIKSFLVDGVVKGDLLNKIFKLYKEKFALYLKTVCQTRTCGSAVLQQLSSYLLFVDQYLNKDLKIVLADSTSVTIQTFRKSGYVGPTDFVFETVTQFEFDQNYNQLPLKN